MEDYIDTKIKEATWKLYKDDEEMLGLSLFGFAIANWKLNHPEEIEKFKQQFIKQNLGN